MTELSQNYRIYANGFFAMDTPVSVTIIAMNEESNIRRAIESVRWAHEVIVVDSGSTDRTREVAASLGAQVVEQPWLGYGAQKNFAQSHASHDWVLNMDADEEVSTELAKEIQTFVQGQPMAWGAAMPRKTHYLGRWIMHGGWYPNVLVRLVHKNHGTWTEPRVHEKLEVRGDIARLSAPLHHYSFKNISDQVQRNIRYAHEGAQALIDSGRPSSALKFQLIWKPLGKFFECYFIKRGLLDGLAGFVIAINAAHSMFLKYAFAIEMKKK